MILILFIQNILEIMQGTTHYLKTKSENFINLLPLFIFNKMASDLKI